MIGFVFKQPRSYSFPSLAKIGPCPDHYKFIVFTIVPFHFRALKTCQGCLSIYPLKETVSTGKVDKESFGWVVYSCILAILRVLLNLTHDNGM